MTFETDAAAVGLAADRAVATVQGLLDAESTHANALAAALTTATDANAVQAAQIVDLQRQVSDLVAAELAEDGTPPPPPPSKTLVGSSGGGWGLAKMLTTIAPKIVRSFTPADAAGVTSGLPIVYSNDANRAAEYALATGHTSDAALEAEWRKAMPDTAIHFLVLLHEEDRSVWGANYTRWAQVQTAAKVIVNKINVGRTHPILLAACITGQPFDDGSYVHWDCPAIDVIAPDNYSRKRWATIISFAASVGKPWGICENGIQAQTNPSLYTDDQVAAAMKADIDTALAGKAAFFCYWPNGGNDLTARPKSTALLKAYCAA